MYIAFAKAIKAHGLKGQLKVRLLKKLKNAQVFPEHFYFELINGFVPFFITQLKRSKQGFLIVCDGLNSPEALTPYLGKKLFLPEDLIDQYFLEDSDSKDLANYMVVVGDKTASFRVVEIIDMPSQKMLVATDGVKEYYIPFVEAFIVNIDHSLKQIVMNLPEGLLAL